LHGAVRLHGFTSSPTPETQVRVAWAEALAAVSSRISAAPALRSVTFFMSISK
jgi:hypothetical protein